MLDGATSGLAPLSSRGVYRDRGSEHTAGRAGLCNRSAGWPRRRPLFGRRQPRAGHAVDRAYHWHCDRVSGGLSRRESCRRRKLPGSRAVPHWSCLGGCLVCRRANPSAARAPRRARRTRPARRAGGRAGAAARRRRGTGPDRPRSARLRRPRDQRDRRPCRRRPAAASSGSGSLAPRAGCDRGAGTADSRGDRSDRRDPPRGVLERIHRGSAQPRVTEYAARTSSVRRARDQGRDRRQPAVVEQSGRSVHLSNPARGPHERGPAWSWERPYRVGVRQNGGRVHRNQSDPRQRSAAVRRWSRADRYAGARDPARWQPEYRAGQWRVSGSRFDSIRGSRDVTRVLIADDDDLMRAGLVELLSNDPTIEIIGQASSGRQAVERARRLAPDVVLMDIRMPDLDGIAATRELSRAAPEARVLILTTFEQDDYVFGALRAGASGFLLKRTRPEELIAGVHTIAAGDSLLSPSVTRRVIDRMAQQPTPELVGKAKLDELTPREREVLALVAQGLSNREIAAVLVVEESTIRTHVKRILMKLDLRDRIQVVIFAYETGMNLAVGAAKPAHLQDRRTG